MAVNKNKKTPEQDNATPEETVDNILKIDDIVWAKRVTDGTMDLQQFIDTCYYLAETTGNDEYRQKALRIKAMLDSAGYLHS